MFPFLAALTGVPPLPPPPRPKRNKSINYHNNTTTRMSRSVTHLAQLHVRVALCWSVKFKPHHILGAWERVPKR